MAELTIKGHPTRGKEVITLLEMLGGTNDYFKLDGTIKSYYYYLFDNVIYQTAIPNDDKYFTLEEFEKIFSYKIKDRVVCIYNQLLEIRVIINMRWDSNFDCVLYYLDDGSIIKVEDILYKIGSPEDNIPTIQDKSTVETIKEHIGTFKPSEGTLVQIDFTKELRIADEVEVILGDYEFVLKDGKTYFVKKKPQYPKT